MSIPADWSFVDTERPLEVQYWAIKLDISVEQLREIVEQVGNSSDAVEYEVIRRAGWKPQAG